MQRWVVLDRDGVINEDRHDFVKTVDEWQPLPGSIDAIARLTRAGFKLTVATNQSGLGRGVFDLDALQAMHAKMNALVEAAGGRLEGVFYCPHTPHDGCACRKPKAGLLDAIERELGCDLTGAPFVGDAQRDLLAALAKGCRPVLVETGKGAATAKKLRRLAEFDNLSIYPNLATFADDWIAKSGLC